MAKLNQLVAVEKGVRNAAERAQTDLYRIIQAPQLFSGISRTYEPKDDDGDRLPTEFTRVQTRVPEVLDQVAKSGAPLYDVTLAKESANGSARADVVVDGFTVLEDVPVTYLLFLERQLVNVKTFVSKLPTLDPSQDWSFDEAQGVWKSRPVQTVRNKKVPRNWVKAEATDKHPAQVEVYHEDVMVGTWTKVDTSGAIPATRKAELLDRVDKLAQAVKFAREQANSAEVTDYPNAGAQIFGYLFGA